MEIATVAQVGWGEPTANPNMEMSLRPMLGFAPLTPTYI